jgi:transposase
MKRFVEGLDRGQSSLFPERLEDWIGEDNPVRVIDVFVDELDLGGLGFERVEPRETGRPGYHPSVLLKLYIYGYLNAENRPAWLSSLGSAEALYLRLPQPG